MLQAMKDARPSRVYRHDFPTAFRAVRKLLADANDTTQVFLIMRALNGPTLPKCFARMVTTPAGRRQTYLRVELAQCFADPAFIASFAPGTVGAAYRSFLAETGYSATGLVEVSKLDREPLVEDSYEWCRRRTRDVHDIWHVLTGYKADESLGEAALVAFSYAQTGGLGWAFIALAAALKSVRVTRSTAFARAVFEGYRRGRLAQWLLIEDYESLLHEPLSSARARLGIGEPAVYREAQAKLGALLVTNG
jgi:ubiquinone biosynthesis protein COQ4